MDNSNTKFDFLVTDICDKLTEAIKLLVNDGYFSECKSLREIYNKYLHPDVLDLKDKKIWDKLDYEEVIDLFQFNTPVGGQAIRSILPRNPLEMMMANALTRLTGEKGQERPIEKYVRFKNDINQWYNECRRWGLNDEDIKILEPYYLPVHGVPTTQEKLMLLCMEPKLAHFTLAEANNARKVCAKKQLNKIPELKNKFVSQCSNKHLGEYVWFSAIEPQMSYAFAEPHALAYSFIAIQILVLVTYYPVIYWNCACLIVNSGGNDYDEDEVIDEDDEDEDEDNENIKKKKTKNTNYGKVATAIGTFQSKGIKILPPDVNSSSYTFSPNAKNNSIIYGLRGITRISSEIIRKIIENRPYESLIDFLSKNKINKLQTLNLIKAGAFDSIEGIAREDIMREYLESIADKKQRLTLQNMQMLINKELIPEEMQFYAKLFLFNKFIKTCKEGINYSLNEAALNFISNNFDSDLIEDGTYILQKTWDNLYKKAMEPMRQYLKDNKDEMLAALNKSLYDEVANKYAAGNISSWEMDSISFYYHEHELAFAQSDFDDFFELSEEPEVEYSFVGNNGQEVKMYKLHRIIGTVIDKDKIRNTINLLTPTGVVTVRIYKNQFALYDKQISEKDSEGVKKIIERSWFKRGTKLMIQGIRINDNFIPKKRKDSIYPVISKIIKIENNKKLEFQFNRLNLE